MNDVLYNELSSWASRNHAGATVALTRRQVEDKSVSDFSETALIMELIGRGFAVSKLPVDEHVEAVK